MKTINTCSQCTHWKNKQAELEYSEQYGICVCSSLKFDIYKAKDAVVLDRQNKSKFHMHVNRFENVSSVVPVGKVEESRYCLVTAKDFGCINFKK